MLSREELDRIAAADEKRLGVGSVEFMQRHNEIMELIDRAERKENRAMKKVFRDYSEMDEKMLEGYTVVSVHTGINAAGSGMEIELEREINGGILGIDVVYDPDTEETKDTPFMISEEYLKHSFDE